MKYLIIFLGCFTLTQATLFNFWSRPAVEVVKEPEPIKSNEYLTPEEILLYNRIYSTNGYGYYPSYYSQFPNQAIQPIATHYNLPAAVNILSNTKPIVIPEIPHLAEEIKYEEIAPFNNEFGTPIVEKKIIEEELALPEYQLPENFNKENLFLTETLQPSSEVHLPLPQVDMLPGQYSHAYILSDGTKVFEEGHLKKSLTTGNEVIVKSGHYEYRNHNGDLHKVNWIADEDGFRVLE